ncbi:MAG: shikimate dehydrogenase [Saprospiraceae bacterium]|nr:shikimate dehydrogenase [Saprospiraceae bacterium]
MRLFGIIGHPLGHSFSQQYFTEKFAREGITDARYEKFPLPDIAALPELIAQQPALCGLNVTIPHKESVIGYLDALDETARAVGAVNVVRIDQGRLTGFNTDVVGLEQSLRPLLPPFQVPAIPPGYFVSPLDGPWPEELFQPQQPKALILGTGGAAKAVAYVLRKLGIGYLLVSRRPDGSSEIGYGDLKKQIRDEPLLMFNTTPLGTYPDTDHCPDIPFERLGPKHLVYDLVYNPPETLLLQRAKARGAAIKNGLEMLQLQAEAAWGIWQQS